MSKSRWLIDQSALTRLGRGDGADEWPRRIERGLVRITTVTLLEAGFSARSATDMRSVLMDPPISWMPIVYMTPPIEDRAVEVLRSLADRGLHRAPSIPDLLVAAAAEMSGLTVLHLDKDFDLIAGVTGQPVERLEVAG